MNIDYRAFIRDNIAFARTIVIKNEDIAIADNQLMLRHYGIPVPQDKSQWRYYLNLAGVYHQTDDMMTVKSLDNEEVIPFTRASLDDHPATRKAYRLGSYYFSRLAAKYPHQIELIQGIINPISYEEAVNAKNYQILRYTKSYIEWNESQLIPLLQEHIDGITYQSFSTEYKFTDNLMLPFLVAHLRETVLRFLITCRFEHRFSRHAHSFFVWSHLQSKGISKIYKPFLNEHQTMWLFRNIDYLLRHLGKQENFELLIAHLLSERDIALTKYDLIQSTETLATTLSPTPLFHSERINLINKKGKGEDTRSLPVVMTKEIPESLDNQDFYVPFLATTTYESTYGEINSYPTKILESEMIDATNSKTETFFMLLNNELIYLAAKDLYTINLDIEDPLTGIHHTIPMKEAIVIWHDLLNLYHGIENDKIGYFCYQGVMKITPPSLSVLMKTGALPFLTEEWCQDVLKLHIPQIRMVSPTVFYENTLAIFHTKWKHKKMASFWASWGYVSQRQNAVDSLYETGFAKLTTETSFKTLREKYQFDFSGYDKSNILNLMWVLWRKMTGWDNFSHQTLAQLQEALINLMRHLSSYSLQYIYQTSVESGWYEAGIDLMTENPSLANRGEDDGNELENDSVDASTLIDEHKVLTIEEAESIAEYKLATLHFDTEYDDTATDALWDNMRLTLVEVDEDAGTEGDIHTFPLYLDSVPTLAYAQVEDNLDKIIPSATTVPEYRALSSVFTPFDGLLNATPYTAVTMRVVKNGFDNGNVLYDYHGLDASPQVITSVNGSQRHYDMSFVPAEPGDYILRLDITTKDSNTNRTLMTRFDYPYTVKAPTWAITYKVSDSVDVGTEFEITPLITGLTLSGANVSYTSWQVDDSVIDYLKVEEKNGKVMGTYLTSERPDKLPLHHCLTTGEGVNARRYYMTGYVPQPQPYDPLTDDDFIPVFRYNEADPNACVRERISIVANKSGWSVTRLEVKRTQGDQLLDDYLGMKNWLGPVLSEQTNTLNSQGTTLRNWVLFYGVASTKASVTLVTTLTHTSGKTLTRTSLHHPNVKDHGASHAFWLSPHVLNTGESADDYLYGVGYTTSVDIGITGISGSENANKTQLSLSRVSVLTDASGQSLLRLPVVGKDDKDLKVYDNQINQMPLTPLTETTRTTVPIALQIDATTPAANGDTLPLVLYGTVSLKGENIVDYDVVDFDINSFTPWGTDDVIYQDVAFPVRKAAKKSRHGWVFQYGSAPTTWPDYIPKELNFGITNSDKLTVSRTVWSGTEKDGADILPSEYAFWVTFRILYQPVDNMPEQALIPFSVTLENRYTGKSATVELKVPFRFSDKRLLTTTKPDVIYAGETLTLVPDWSAVPFETHIPMQRTRRTFYSFGTYYFVKQDGTNRRASCKLGNDYNITMSLPPPYISRGRGIYMVLVSVWEAANPDDTQSSLSYITYYQIVDFVLNRNIFTTERPVN